MVFFVCIGILCLVAVVLATKGRDKTPGSSTASSKGELAVRSLGADAYVKVPTTFVSGGPRVSGSGGSFSSPEGVEPTESMTISKLYNRPKGMTIDTLTEAVTTNSNGTLPGITYEKIQRQPNNSGDSDNSSKIVDMLKVSYTDDATKMMTTQYYYLYEKKVWLLTLLYKSGTFLDKSQVEIANSFVAGNLL